MKKLFNSVSQFIVYFLYKLPIDPLDPSPNTYVFSLDPDLSLSSSFSLHSNDYEYDLKVILQYAMNFLTSSICLDIINPLHT